MLVSTSCLRASSAASSRIASAASWASVRIPAVCSPMRSSCGPHGLNGGVILTTALEPVGELAEKLVDLAR